MPVHRKARVGHSLQAQPGAIQCVCALPEALLSPIQSTRSVREETKPVSCVTMRIVVFLEASEGLEEAHLTSRRPYWP
jgi:hypothetical protein